MRSAKLIDSKLRTVEETFGYLIAMRSERRQFAFRNLDEVLPDVERLLVGHRTVGRWTLGQICNHLASSIHYSISGFPGGSAPWLVRVTVGKIARWSLLKHRKIPEGMPLPRKFAPLPELDISAEIAALRNALQAFEECAAPAAHPLVGNMTKAEWSTFHCTHCAHHLSFAVPT